MFLFVKWLRWLAFGNPAWFGLDVIWYCSFFFFFVESPLIILSGGILCLFE